MDVSARRERGIPAPNPINAGRMAGPAQGEGGYSGEGEEEVEERKGRAGGRDAALTHRQ